MTLATSSAVAKSSYQKPAQFVSEAFQGEIPKPTTYWLSKQDKLDIAGILKHKYSRLRLRYWQKNTVITNANNRETVWILNEIGKDKPITIGIHIKNHQIVQLKVLTYRERRGDEVRHSFFTDQFNFAKLTKNNRLDRTIDGITGATMSVRALTKVARLALWLDKKILQEPVND
jgi:uncharacterized protein with FMN-binding domain